MEIPYLQHAEVNPAMTFVYAITSHTDTTDGDSDGLSHSLSISPKKHKSFTSDCGARKRQ